MTANTDLLQALNALLVSVRLYFKGPLGMRNSMEERDNTIGQLAVIDYLIGEGGTLPPKVVTHPGDAIYTAYKDLQADYDALQQENERLRGLAEQVEALETKVKTLRAAPPGYDIIHRDRLTAYRTLSSAVDRLLNNTDAATDDTSMARVREAHRRLLESGRPE